MKVLGLITKRCFAAHQILERHETHQHLWPDTPQARDSSPSSRAADRPRRCERRRFNPRRQFQAQFFGSHPTFPDQADFTVAADDAIENHCRCSAASPVRHIARGSISPAPLPISIERDKTSANPPVSESTFAARARIVFCLTPSPSYRLSFPESDPRTRTFLSPAHSTRSSGQVYINSSRPSIVISRHSPSYR